MSRMRVAALGAALVVGLTAHAAAAVIEGAGGAGLSAVPEPGTWLLMGTGMILILGYMRRKRSKAREAKQQAEEQEPEAEGPAEEEGNASVEG